MVTEQVSLWIMTVYGAFVSQYCLIVWESEEWLQQYAKPLAQSGGVQGRGAKDPGENDDQDETMEEA